MCTVVAPFETNSMQIILEEVLPLRSITKYIRILLIARFKIFIHIHFHSVNNHIQGNNNRDYIIKISIKRHIRFIYINILKNLSMNQFW